MESRRALRTLEAMWRFILTARLKRGAFTRVREILREGPPFDLAGTSLERHQVFLARDEIVFVFEGLHAEEEVRHLLSDPGVLGRTGRLVRHLQGLPRTLEEVFSWERPIELDGVSFQADPGPGDSDGG